MADARHLLRKTSKDIDRKQGELRELVSVRYRDFIDAADTISAMGTSARTIAASLPPISSVTRRTSSAQAFMMDLPVGTEPVNDTLATPACDASAVAGHGDCPASLVVGATCWPGEAYCGAGEFELLDATYCGFDQSLQPSPCRRRPALSCCNEALKRYGFEYAREL